MSTKKVIGVIGTGYGDEGKGKTVSYFCHKYRDERPLVIRYNGGAQAAHNVILDNGVHHTFQHFGSGTFFNVPTYFRNQFIVNPILFMNEMMKLIELNNKSFDDKLSPFTIFDPNCRISLPYDMLYNLAVEFSRGKENHGTCGVGIFATITRYQNMKNSLTLKQLMDIEDQDILFNYMDDVRRYYIKEMEKLEGIDEYLEVLKINDTKESFWNTLNQMKQYIYIKDFNDIIDQHDTFICESAQGLLLSERFGTFPHLTPSDPGCAEIVKLTNEIIEESECELELNYVTRAYATRHGAGPLKDEDTAENLGICTKDEINNDKGNQGIFRYAPLDIYKLMHVIVKDVTRASKRLSKKSEKFSLGNVFINGCDQIDNSRNISICIRNGLYQSFRFFSRNKPNVMCGIGPKTNDMIKLQELPR